MRNREFGLRRRDFIAAVSLGTTGLAFSSLYSAFAADVPRRETADVIVGPFYPQVKPRDKDADLTLLRGRKARANGQLVTIAGRVVNLRGEPVRRVIIEVWQANSSGRYSHPSDPNTHLTLDPNFQGYALVHTDNDGRYMFTTIKPGPYPTARGDMRAPHIHFEIHGRVDRKVTQLFFPNEPLNDRDRHLNSVRRPETLIADVSPSSHRRGELIAEWNITLAAG